MAVTTFLRYRPKKTVKLQKQIPLNSCLCEICTNFKLKSKALVGAGLKNVVCNGRDAVDITICPHKHLVNNPDPCVSTIGRYGYYKCLFRKCRKCGVKKMKRRLELVNRKMFHENKNVNWCVWEGIERNLKKGNKIFKVRRVERLHKSGSLQELVNLYIRDLEKLSTHIFLSRYQYHQAVDLRDNLPNGLLLCSHDFATNFYVFFPGGGGLRIL